MDGEEGKEPRAAKPICMGLTPTTLLLRKLQPHCHRCRVGERPCRLPICKYKLQALGTDSCPNSGIGHCGSLPGTDKTKHQAERVN